MTLTPDTRVPPAHLSCLHVPSTLGAEVNAIATAGGDPALFLSYPYRRARYGVHVDDVDWTVLHAAPPHCATRVALEALVVRVDAKVAELRTSGSLAAVLDAADVDADDCDVDAGLLGAALEQLGVDATDRDALWFRATDYEDDTDRWLDAMVEDCSCERCGMRLSPFTAAVLAEAAILTADMMEQDAFDLASGEEPQDTFVSLFLPPLAMPLVSDMPWFVQLQHTFHVLAARLTVGQVPYPRSTAEEVVLHAAFSYARDRISDGELDECILGLLEADDLDGWDAALDWIFEDHDVLFLFDPSFDGIEDSDLADDMGMVNLHPRDWHSPFRACCS